MKVEFKLTEQEKAAILEEMRIEHSGYYGQPWGARYGLGLTLNRDTFAWTSSRGNALTVKGNWARYEGTRHGLIRGGFLHRVARSLRAAQNRGDWRYIATQEPDWLPLETERDHG